MWRALVLLCFFELRSFDAFGDAGLDCLLDPDDVSLLQATAASIPHLTRPKIDLNEGNVTRRVAAVGDTSVKTDGASEQSKARALDAFLAAVMFKGIIFCGLVVAFVVLQRYYPMIYAHPATHGFTSPDPFKGDAPYRWSTVYNKSWFGWARVSYMVTSQEVEASSGLDAAMLLVYTHLSIELMAVIGLPLCMIGIPIYFVLGGGLEQDDKLSWIGFGNVVYGPRKNLELPPYSAEGLLTAAALEEQRIRDLRRVQWIFWLVGFTVFAVVVYVQQRLSVYQQRFLDRRMEWLKKMPESYANTVLVTGIKEGYNTDAKLFNFFSDMFGAQEVKSAFVVKKLHETALPTLMADYQKKEDERLQLEYAMKKPLLQICSRLDPNNKGKLTLLHILELYDNTAEVQSACSSINVERDDLQDVGTQLKDQDTEEVEYFKLITQLVQLQEQKLIDNPSQNCSTELLSAMQKVIADKQLIEKNITQEQLRVKRISAVAVENGSDDDLVKQEQLYSTSGFVTFYSRAAAARSLGVQMCQDDHIWSIETPPQPHDVRYHALEEDENEAAMLQFWGYVAVIGLFLALTPLVLMLTTVSQFVANSSFIKRTGTKPIVEGVLPSLGLTILMNMTLPTLIVWIFQMFFRLKAERWAQLHLQEYYFSFLMLLVLLITSIGLSGATGELVLSHFARTLPFATHFYLAYICMQCVTHALNLTRYMTLIKFLLFKRSYDVEIARGMAEPEDQDCYGMGSRSARFTFMLVIGLVFGTICPLMNLLVIANFLACRLIYGYLIPFAEGRKIDQGGEHWCMQMRHTHIGVLIYIVTMTGMLAYRSESIVPPCVAGSSFLWWLFQYRRFRKSQHGEKLAYTDLNETKGSKDDDVKDLCSKGMMYCQSELDWTPPRRTPGTFWL